ncbi:tripartite motif-containing protein 66-like isoform X1 [Sinocyclocheilus grahami]|uniref:tripartite motif-containing protein 66-like isoform X1 n=1 Tax=Sinocyclocheilus grahami TaxID=75366 RepID=UPI0007AD54BC|nr:PREDICTED: tripartite motif-containing protein 66-like isoform X1 [Sinocyclocheilus grahami]XP_016138446.1 PREDICTED: tripartite motif-containing protein 66-like isoform X1 [Sinocyclocheilus grahami]
MEKCCSECSEPRMAQSLCTFCNKWLCFQCTDLHQHERSFIQPFDLQHQPRDLPSSSEIGAGCCGHAVVMCSLHKQEPLELLCETCDLMACSICHLSAHKDHRLVHVGKALQDQRWLLQNLMARVEEKRSAVESTAKQIQGRLHGIKITQRKAENQIKMAKMIMMNELNKRANLLIEQLESISSDFKQRLEDQLQGAIELCSQLERVQNFITWATAHHRCNPLLFSKELIALQMQQLLEPLMLSEAWTSLKIKFNWDASFWTKQMSTLGQLVVEGGSRSYSEVVGHPSILRPQPVPCIAIPPLCHAVHEPGCACQTFFQPQLCCLHCRPTQSVPLDKFPAQCPQATRRSSPPSLHSCWEADASVPVHPPGAQPIQPSTSHPGSDLVQHGASSASPRQPVGSNNHPLPANSNQAAMDGRKSAPGQPPCERGQTSAPEATTGQEASPDSELPRVHNQAQVQTTTETSNQPMIELQPIVARIDDDRRSSALEMFTLAQGRGGDDQSRSGSKRATRSQSNSKGPRGPRKSLCKARPNRAAHSLATVAGDQECTTQQQVCARPDASEMMPGHISSHTASSLTTYKSEPDNVYAYAYENRKPKTRKKNRLSREDPDTSDKEAPDGSKVPVVCLERLKILVSRHPPQNHQGTDLISQTESGLKPEETVFRVLERKDTSQETLDKESVQTEDSVSATEQLSPEHLHSSEPSGSLEVSQLPVQEFCNINQESGVLAISNDSDPILQSDTEEIHSPSELRSVTGSDFQTESVREAEPGSDADVESELLQESDPSSQFELQVEFESDVISEQPSESVLSASEQEFESDPDSTAEVTLNLEPEPEWVLPPAAGSETVSEPAAEHQPTEESPEIENEDFCAVCLIGGDLLCCDRCPKVFHLSCHVPPLHSFPIGDWICTLCRDVEQPEVEYDCENDQMSTALLAYGLSACDQRKCEKLTLLILSNILSAPFHEPVSPLARHYYQIIKKPMDLSVIRNRLSRTSNTHYRSPQEFVTDVLLMFKNCGKFNYSDSEVAQAGHSLQSFFTSKLREVFPDLTCPVQEEEDSENEDYEELERAMVTGFPWPERKEQSHRKRKRRHSLNWRRNHY